VRRGEEAAESLGSNARGRPFPGVFNPRPAIESFEPEVTVLACQDDVWVASFHPELSGDLRLHRRFLDEVTNRR